MTLVADTPTVRVVEPEELTPYLGTEDAPDDDGLLARLIAVATERVESHTGRACITREFTETRFVCDYQRRITPHRAPVIEVESVTIDGNLIDADNYELIGDCIVLDPFVLGQRSLVLVYTAGYGETAAAVPEALKLAVMRLAATLFEHRENIQVGTISGDMPSEVAKIAYHLKRNIL